MAKARIVIVEDDPDIRELVSFTLGKEGYEVSGVASGEDGLTAIRASQPDLVILDIMLPGMDGLEVLRAIKSDKELAPVPVIMVSARGEDPDVVSGLELGAEDYVVKPFSPRVLVARVRAALRRKAKATEPVASGMLTAGGILLDPERHEVSIEGRKVDLSATEFSLLELLMRSPGRVYSRATIIDTVKGRDYPVTDRSVDVQVVSLRRRLGSAGELIETVRGVGYRFKDDSHD